MCVCALRSSSISQNKAAERLPRPRKIPISSGALVYQNSGCGRNGTGKYREIHHKVPKCPRGIPSAPRGPHQCHVVYRVRHGKVLQRRAGPQAWFVFKNSITPVYVRVLLRTTGRSIPDAAGIVLGRGRECGLTRAAAKFGQRCIAVCAASATVVSDTNPAVFCTGIPMWSRSVSCPVSPVRPHLWTERGSLGSVLQERYLSRTKVR